MLLNFTCLCFNARGARALPKECPRTPTYLRSPLFLTRYAEFGASAGTKGRVLSFSG